MSLYFKSNEDNNLICDTKKTTILIDSRNHISINDSNGKSSRSHFDNMIV